ncbi:MAG: hypothetical protein K6A65_05070 [Succinivibrionaceae bacterium]|nr:hypothetical protein [Succinivibrionaceae bacterium]
MIPENLTSSLSGLLDSFPLTEILIVLAILVTLYILFRVIAYIIKRKRYSKEVSSLKKDLMVWSVLSSLIRGGKTSDKAKVELTQKIQELNDDFTTGLKYLDDNRYLGQSQPWFVLLGEPVSGKTTLLNKSDVELKTAREPAGRKPTVTFRVNRSAVVLDVAGEIFFDRWVGTSSAEWTELCHLINTKHSSFPLSGVILTIPADSLLADDAKITAKKAGLIQSELSRLTNTLHMHLPCYVLVTKLDTVVGFREFFVDFDEKRSSQVFGDYGDSTKFNPDKFDAFFADLENRLTDMMLAIMMGQKPRELSSAGQNRLMYTAGMYLFISSLRQLVPNLRAYIEKIFPDQYGEGEPDLIYKGFFFTSAEDQGICLSDDFARFKNQDIDSVPLADPNPPSSHPYFIDRLLSDFIFPNRREAYFSQRAELRRHVPVAICSAVMLFLSLVYLYGAFVTAPDMQLKFRETQSYYHDLAQLMANQSLSDSPLLGTTPQGSGVLHFDEPMAHDHSFSRINFFNQVQMNLDKELSIPLVFRPASWLLFGLNDQIGLTKRYQLLNYLQTQMAFVPMIDALNYNLSQNRGAPFTLAKSKAYFLHLSLSIPGISGVDLSPDDSTSRTMLSFIDYLFPSLNENSRMKLARYYARYDFYEDFVTQSLLLDPLYLSACTSATRDLISNWTSLQNYPDTPYVDLRDDILAANELVAVYNRILKSNQINLSEMSQYDLEQLVIDFSDLSNQVDRYAKVISIDARRLLVNVGAEKKDANNKEKRKEDSSLGVFERSYHAYRGILDDDFSRLSDFIRQKLKKNDSNSSIFSNLSPESLAGIKNKVTEKLEAEYKNLNDIVVKAKSSILFKSADGSPLDDQHLGSGIDIKFNYDVLNDLLKLCKYGDASRSDNSPRNFMRRFIAIDSDYRHQLQLLENYIEHNSDNEMVAQLGVFFKKFLLAKDYVNKYKLTQQLLKYYPSVTSTLSAMTRMSNILSDTPFELSDDMFSNISIGTASDILGGFDIRPEFNPSGYLNYLKPINELVLAQSEDPKNNKMFADYVKRDPRIGSVIDMMRVYSLNFITYWSNLVDRIKLTARDYEEFHEMAATRRAYQVNSQLQNLYDLSYFIVNSVSDTVLDETGLAQKKQILEKLDLRRKTINIQFTDNCETVMNAWGELPEDAAEANRAVMYMDQEDVQNDLMYFAKVQKGQDYIPWWTNFTQLGAKLLKKDASYEAGTSLAEYQSELYRFPIISDGNPADPPLTQEDIEGMQVMLKSFGLVVDQQAGKDEEEGSKRRSKSKDRAQLQRPLRLTSNDVEMSKLVQWSTTIDGLLNSLSNKGRSLTFSIMPVDLATQMTLNEENTFSSAIPRYRYMSIEMGKTSSGLLSTSISEANTTKAFLQGNADSDPITFNFYRFSDSDEPDVSIKVDGGWPALQLYLDRQGKLDEKAGLVILPLRLEDPAVNGFSVYHIGVKFNKPLPPPDQWPSSSNWPRLTVFRDVSTY